jgi:putative ABC transport system ATP-binding protein
MSGHARSGGGRDPRAGNGHGNGRASGGQSRRERPAGDRATGGRRVDGGDAGGRSRQRARRQSRGAGTAARDGTPTLALRNVVKRYRTGGKTLTALKGVDFDVHAGEFVTIMGPSGSGKTTMLNVLGLLDHPTEGAVYFDGHDVTGFDDERRTRQRRRTIGFVFQDFYLLESLTAKENVEVPAMFSGAGDRSDRAERLLELVGLGDRVDHYPNELSGGQQQRVAIARSLINEPRIVLADEPTGNLDEETSHQILDLLGRICSTGAAVVAVTHDPLVSEYAAREVNVTNGHLTRGER